MPGPIERAQKEIIERFKKAEEQGLVHHVIQDEWEIRDMDAFEQFCKDNPLSWEHEPGRFVS